MIAPVGILTLLIATASSPEAAVSAAPLLGHDRDRPIMPVVFQQASPFEDEEPQPVPPAGFDNQPPMPMPPVPDGPVPEGPISEDPIVEDPVAESPAAEGADDAGQSGALLPTVVPPSGETSPHMDPLADEMTGGNDASVDFYFGESDGEGGCGDYGCGGDACGDYECGGHGCGGGASNPRCSYPWGFHFEGWIAQGASINVDSPANRSNFPVAFNDRANDYQMNQLYLVLSRPVGTDGGWGIGGRVDMLYGTDSVFATSRGLELGGDLSPKWNSERYGLAMPQCYMEASVPLGNGVNMKLGHFYTILGYESTPAADNFFYSHSYALTYGEPITHTGFLGSTRLGSLTFHAGMTRGWDNWEDNNNDFAFLGGLSWMSRDQRTLIGYAIHTGREQDEPPPNTNGRTVGSLVVQHQLSPDLQYVMQYDHGFEEQGVPGGGSISREDADWYGVSQYMFYTLNCDWKAGMRFEWFRDEEGTRVHAGRGANYFALTSGLNWTPTPRIVVRPELRWDWIASRNFHPFDGGRRHDQLLLNCDVIVKF